MRFWNRWKLLWGYLRRSERLAALPVEYIVETTAKCNLYCPMCVRETYKQPKADMSEAIFERLVGETSSSAEHMMLIGLGEPLMDSRIFDRIEHCRRHKISTLLSTNGTFLDEATSRRLLDTGLEHITLSFDGGSKESFEFYRKGARFEKVRDNFVGFARLKKRLGARTQVVVQMVRMERNSGEVGEFRRFWEAVEGVDQVRIKEDETNLMRPSGHPGSDWKWPCHYLWRGPLYVKQDGGVYPCCQSYMLGGRPVGRVGETGLEAIWNAEEMRRMRRLHAAKRAGEIDICARCCTTIPHPALVIASLLFHGDTVRRLLPAAERLAYFSRLGRGWLRPSQNVPDAQPLVKIQSSKS